MTNAAKPHVLLVCSSGGHLREALAAMGDAFSTIDVATYRVEHVKTIPCARRVFYLIDPHVSAWKYAVNALQSAVLLVRVRPKIILTTGAGIALCCAILGKWMGAKLIVVDTIACVDDLSRTGRLLYRFADLFIVQWPELCAKYPRAIYGGCVL